MRRKIVVLAAFAILASAAAGAFALTRSPGHHHAAAPIAAAAPAVPVVAERVKTGDVPIYLRGIGYVEAYNTVVVRSQIQGQLVSIPFTEGQTVHAGDLLAQIDPRPYQAQLDQAIANRDRDAAQLTNAEANLQRYLPLQAKGFATPQLVDTQKAQVAQLQAAVKADDAVIESAQVELGYTRITAPINGVTGIRQIDVGNIIHPTDPNGLVVLTQLQPISAIFTLPEGELPKIQQQMAKGPLTVLAYSQDDKIQLDQGTLSLIDNQIIQTSGSIRLKAKFPNPQHRLWPGELINVRLLLDTRHDGMTVASSAIQQGPDGTYVYVIGPNGTVASRPVKLGESSGGRTLIDSGLTPDEEVVDDGQSRLQAGTRVAVLHGQAAEQFARQSATQAQIP
ncbi:MAG TPA: efflux RND transporter periplasmic adaptor subunit [Stellaceae bacterium]|nr:efflux RND transporter periplasmic adaptor subunit [Stellaceae bacterium]